MATEAQATIFLEPWQVRMLKDFTKLKQVEKITKLIIEAGPIYCPASYKVPPDGMRRDDWLIYLTDTQMRQVREQLKLRTAVSSININAEAMAKGSIKFM